jgi:hypothetical protein
MRRKKSNVSNKRWMSSAANTQSKGPGSRRGEGIFCLELL